MNVKALFLVLIIALAADAVTGFTSTIGGLADAQTFQSGPAQCTFAQIPPTGLEVPGCTGVITFPTAFNKIPKHYGINTQCMSNTLQTLTDKTADQVCAGLGIQSGHLTTTIFAKHSFESDNGQTWINMPVAQTELYGNANHEITVNPIGLSNAIFSVNCIVASNGASAILRPQFLNPATGIWYNLASIAGALDLAVNFFLCGSGSGGQTISANAPINNTIQTFVSPFMLLRVVGIGGGGVGDNPVFNEITVDLSTTVPVIITPSIGYPPGGAVVTTTTMKFWVTAINPNNGIGTLVPIFSWWACVC